MRLKKILAGEVLPSLETVLQTLDANVKPVSLDFVNWTSYPYKPDVAVQLANNEHAFFIKYQVREKAVMALATEPNGEVWTDSCVEFFVSPDNGADYYNFEFNCIGTALLGYNAPGQVVTHASADQIATIRRMASLGNQPFAERKGDFEWHLVAAIPFEVLFKHDFKPVPGQKLRVNFYKCGDHLSEPHFVAWTKIDTEQPSFHQPAFFGEVVFGD